MSTLMVAVLGPDRPGIIAALSEVLLGEGGNLEDASMTLLGGQFAMTLVVSGPADAAAARRDLAPVAARLGVDVLLREVGPAVGAASSSAWALRVHGADSPGIVHRATALLARHGGNVTDLSTRLAGGAYVLVAGVDLPVDADVRALRSGLTALAAELGVDASLEPADEDVL